MARAYIETEVEVELSDFDVDDLVDELESRGYTVLDNDDSRTEKAITRLYYDWLQMTPERFNEEIKKFFSEALNKHIL